MQSSGNNENQTSANASDQELSNNYPGSTTSLTC